MPRSPAAGGKRVTTLTIRKRRQLAEGLESIEYGWMLDRARLCPEVSALRSQETVRRLEVSIDRSSRDPASAVRSAVNGTSAAHPRHS